MRLVPALAACALLGAPAAGTAAPVDNTETDAGNVHWLHGYLARSFALPKDLPIDPALRSAADQIAKAHMARMDQLLQVWINEERASRPGGAASTDDANLQYAVWARMLNEVALWYLEPGDAAYEQATLATLRTSPMACRTGDVNAHFLDYGARILRIQAMPAALRPAMLESERKLLARWGQPRPAPAPRPYPSPQDAALTAIAQIRAGGERPQEALPPVLASVLLGNRHTGEEIGWDVRCGVQQWWLRVSLARGSTPAVALSSFRYGTLLTASYRFGNSFETDGGDAPPPGTPAKPQYPKMAQRFALVGSTMVTRTFDKAGNPVQASVSARDITVPGIRGVRPVPFEDAFDALSIVLGLQPVSPGKPDVKMVWKLEPPSPARKGATP
jgi:hypothetical protein